MPDMYTIEDCRPLVNQLCFVMIPNQYLVLREARYFVIGGVPNKPVWISKGKEYKVEEYHFWTEIKESPCCESTEHHNNGISVEDVVLMRELYFEKVRLERQLKELTYKSLGRKFGVHSRTVNRIVMGHSRRSDPFPNTA